MNEKVLSVPHYMITLPSGSYVIDAYFIDKVSYTPRKSLLIFPESIVNVKDYYDMPPTVLSTDLDVHDVYKIISKAYSEVRRRVYEDVKRLMHRSQLRLLIPLPKTSLEISDREARSALIIFEKVFERCSMNPELDIKSWSRVYVVIKILKVHDEIRVKAPKPIPKIYSWLYIVDPGFREAIDEVMNY